MENILCWQQSVTVDTTVEGSQNNIGEESHDGSADQARDRDRDKPGNEDVPEQMPVDRLPGAQPSHGHH